MSPDQVKPKTIKLIFVVSPLSKQHEGERAKTGWLGIRIICQSGATCLSVDCCFRDTIKKSTKCVGLVQNGPLHHLIKNELVVAMI